ncbi:fungal-specific transcription factor domain-containing protein [Xylariales sp. PMI_506]|nr:fungal-specific transcription factor domain-containing protein [Xylariales sp. PMI_506]
MLNITCHYEQDKPEWMDGGVKQEEMAEQLKREVKEKAQRRRGERGGERAVHSSDHSASGTDTITGDLVMLSPSRLRNPSILNGPEGRQSNGAVRPCPMEFSIGFQRDGIGCTLSSSNPSERVPFGRSDTILLTFYLEHLLTFLFPFYHPSLLQGGKGWVLEMMVSSPVVRQTALCQSSYFFSLARETANHDVLWEMVLAQTRDAFEVLRQSLQVLSSWDIAEHMHGAARIMAGIMQVQRFEIAVLSFSNCQAHLNGALAIFEQMLNSTGAVESATPSSRFHAVVDKLGPTSWVLPTQGIQVPSAEQAAFHFSSSLLILDDIIASTVLQEQPKLYKYHGSLLGLDDGAQPTIDLETTVGCQNWVMRQIGEIAMLDAWKQQCKRAGNLDVMELVRRATAIKEPLQSNLTRLESSPATTPVKDNGLLDILTADYYRQSKASSSQSSLITRVWAHAALIYLFVVVSGWQPASAEVHYHVSQIIQLLTHEISPPALLRTAVWPFCVAGCLAEPTQACYLRSLVEPLQPPSVFGTVRKALGIMEEVWRSRNSGDAASRDLAACFRSQGDLILLV